MTEMLRSPSSRAPATSTDANYSGLDAADVAVTNLDNDTAGITVGAISRDTTEAGGTATFTMVLNSQPTADVTIGLSSSDASEGTVTPASVTFTAANWSISRIVTVSGVNDDLDDGDVAYTIVTAAATSTDSNYNNMNAADVSVTNTDDDTAGITVSPTSGLMTTEAGGAATFTIVLNTQPTANVTIGLTSSDTSEGSVSPAERDVHGGKLEHGSNRDGDRRSTTMWTTATWPTRSPRPRPPARTPTTTA